MVGGLGRREVSVLGVATQVSWTTETRCAYELTGLIELMAVLVIGDDCISTLMTHC